MDIDRGAVEIGEHTSDPLDHDSLDVFLVFEGGEKSAGALRRRKGEG